MGILKMIGNQVTGAIGDLLNRNRRTALINRLGIIIKNERENSARAYVALGKYYYENLRDPENHETEPLCASIDESDRRLQRAFDKMEQLREESEKPDDDSCAGCTSDCDTCNYSVSIHPDSEAAPYDKYDTTPSSIAHDPDNIEVDSVRQPEVITHPAAAAPTPAEAVAPDTEAADEETAPSPESGAPKA